MRPPQAGWSGKGPLSVEEIFIKLLFASSSVCLSGRTGSFGSTPCEMYARFYAPVAA
jgi:hypothetical protein